MTPRTIEELLAQVEVRERGAAIEFAPRPEWTVDDEPQLSYTSIVSLAECCREWHWRRDLESLVGTTDLDATARSLAAQYLRPIMVGSVLTLSYAVTDLGSTSYVFATRFTSEDGELRALVDVELVFIRPGHPGRAEAPDSLRQRLAQLRSTPEPVERT